MAMSFVNYSMLTIKTVRHYQKRSLLPDNSFPFRVLVLGGWAGGSAGSIASPNGRTLCIIVVKRCSPGLVTLGTLQVPQTQTGPMYHRYVYACVPRHNTWRALTHRVLASMKQSVKCFPRSSLLIKGGDEPTLTRPSRQRVERDNVRVRANQSQCSRGL